MSGKVSCGGLRMLDKYHCFLRRLDILIGFRKWLNKTVINANVQSDFFSDVSHYLSAYDGFGTHSLHAILS